MAGGSGAAGSVPRGASMPSTSKGATMTMAEENVHVLEEQALLLVAQLSRLAEQADLVRSQLEGVLRQIASARAARKVDAVADAGGSAVEEGVSSKNDAHDVSAKNDEGSDAVSKDQREGRCSKIDDASEETRSPGKKRRVNVTMGSATTTPDDASNEAHQDKGVFVKNDSSSALGDSNIEEKDLSVKNGYSSGQDANSNPQQKRRGPSNVPQLYPDGDNRFAIQKVEGVSTKRPRIGWCHETNRGKSSCIGVYKCPNYGNGCFHTERVRNRVRGKNKYNTKGKHPGPKKLCNVHQLELERIECDCMWTVFEEGDKWIVHHEGSHDHPTPPGFKSQEKVDTSSDADMQILEPIINALPPGPVEKINEDSATNDTPPAPALDADMKVQQKRRASEIDESSEDAESPERFEGFTRYPREGGLCVPHGGPRPEANAAEADLPSLAWTTDSKIQQNTGALYPNGDNSFVIDKDDGASGKRPRIGWCHETKRGKSSCFGVYKCPNYGNGCFHTERVRTIIRGNSKYNTGGKNPGPKKPCAIHHLELERIECDCKWILSDKGDKWIVHHRGSHDHPVPPKYGTYKASSNADMKLLSPGIHASLLEVKSDDVAEQNNDSWVMC